MNLVEAALRGIARDLADLHVGWALIGGFAVSIRAETRFTRDVDAAVAVGGDDEAEELVQVLSTRGYVLNSIIDHDVSGRLATARLNAPLPATVFVDLLFASSGIEPELVVTAERLEVIPGLVLPVASVAGLIVTKLLARDDTSRPQDAMDLRGLTAVAQASDLEEARALARLVEERGYQRGRDLVAAVAGLPPAHG